MVRDPDDALDLAQTVFLKAFEHLHGFDPAYRFYSWLYRIAIHETLNHQRRAGRMHSLERDAVAHGLDPERELAGVELSRTVQAALMKLDPAERAILVLRHFVELSYGEIAAIVGIPEKTVKSRLFSARQKLRQRLERTGVVP